MKFVGYLGGSKGWTFWNPDNNSFVESAHARWLSDDADTLPTGDCESSSVPVPDRPSSISKLLNHVDCVEGELLEALEVTYDL